MNKDKDDAGEYYTSIQLKRIEAWRRVREARERDADPREIARLEQLALYAGYTGD